MLIVGTQNPQNNPIKVYLYIFILLLSIDGYANII